MIKFLQKLNRSIAILSFTRPWLVGGLIYLLGVIAGPLAMIWAWNTLFSIGTPYSFQTWLASLFLIWTINFVLNFAVRSATRRSD